jgi:C-terminal processing protease CtpA/Prc
MAMVNRVMVCRWPKTAMTAAVVASAFVLLCAVGPAAAGSKSKKDASAEAEKTYEKALVISKKSDKPFLGVNMQELDDQLRKGLDLKTQGGVLVTDVIESSPAEEAGIEDGDIIVEFNGHKVDSPSKLQELVEEVKVGDTVKVKVVRENTPKTITVTMGEYPDDERWSLSGEEPFMWLGQGRDALVRAFGRGRLGVEATDINEDLGPYFGVKEGEGVLVLGVTKGSPGEEMGIKAGDVITKVNGEKVGSVSDLREAVRKIDGGDSFDVVLVRTKKDITLQGKMDEDLATQYYRMAPRKFDIPKTDVRVMTDREIDKLKKEMKDLKKEIQNLKEELEKVRKST